jgi:hypothetical protein
MNVLIEKHETHLREWKSGLKSLMSKGLSCCIYFSQLQFGRTRKRNAGQKVYGQIKFVKKSNLDQLDG